MRSLTAREVDVVDCAYLFIKKKHGDVPPMMTIDLSQSVNRLPWQTDGRMPSPTCCAKIFFQRKVLNFSEMMLALGWPRGGFRTPAGLTDSQAKSLVGNIISPPVAGGIFLSLLAAISIGTVDCRISWA